MIDAMKTVNLDIPEATFRDFERLGKEAQREPAELMREALERYRTERIAPLAKAGRQSVLDHEPMSVGAILKPWTSRAEMLEDFFDRD